MGLLGKYHEDKEIKSKIILIPYYFLFMNISVFQGFNYLIKKKKGDGTWEKAKRSSIG